MNRPESAPGPKRFKVGDRRTCHCRDHRCQGQNHFRQRQILRHLQILAGRVDWTGSSHHQLRVSSQAIYPEHLANHYSGRTLERGNKNAPKTARYYWVDTTIVPYLGEDRNPNNTSPFAPTSPTAKRAHEQTAEALREVGDVKSALDEHAIVAITDATGKDQLRQRQVLRHFQILPARNSSARTIGSSIPAFIRKNLFATSGRPLAAAGSGKERLRTRPRMAFLLGRHHDRPLSGRRWQTGPIHRHSRRYHGT